MQISNEYDTTQDFPTILYIIFGIRTVVVPSQSLYGESNRRYMQVASIELLVAIVKVLKQSPYPYS